MIIGFGAKKESRWSIDRLIEMEISSGGTCCRKQNADSCCRGAFVKAIRVNETNKSQQTRTEHENNYLNNSNDACNESKQLSVRRERSWASGKRWKQNKDWGHKERDWKRSKYANNEKRPEVCFDTSRIRVWRRTTHDNAPLNWSDWIVLAGWLVAETAVKFEREPEVNWGRVLSKYGCYRWHGVKRVKRMNAKTATFAVFRFGTCDVRRK